MQKQRLAGRRIHLGMMATMEQIGQGLQDYRSTYLRFMLMALALPLIAACGPIHGDDDVGELEMPPGGAVVQTLTLEPLATATASAGDLPERNFPDLVWLPFTSGLDDSRSVITVRPGKVGFEPSPVDLALFWDYGAATGKLAYASEFWHAASGSNRSVSDLWVYDYTTEDTTQWLPDNVSRALWSPVLRGDSAEQRLAAAIYNTETGHHDLALVHGPGQVERLASCASSSFSWSPDGSRLAYAAFDINEPEDLPEECEGIFVLSVEDGSLIRLSGSLPIRGGWVGIRPIWAEGQNALLYPGGSPEALFWVIPLDGSGAYQIEEEEAARNVGQDFLSRPQHALWSIEHRSLIGQIDAMTDPFGVWVYTFAEDMRAIEDAYRIDWGDHQHDTILVDWWEAGESVLLRDRTNTSPQNPFGEAAVWSLSNRQASELAFSRPVIDVPLHSQETRTGVAEVDKVIENFLSQDFKRRKGMILTLTTGCTTAEAVVRPPSCTAGQDAGTLVEVFPYREHRATKYVSPEELAKFLEFPLGGLYAVYRVPQGGFAQEWWPAGEYSVVFVTAEDDFGVEVILEGDQVVRIEFHQLTPVEYLCCFDGEYLLPPLTE